MNKVTKNILKYLIEIVIVAFGVFLGVYFSNLNAENKTNAEKDKSLQIIIKELEYNQQLLDVNINYHENLKSQIDSIVPTLSEKVKFSNIVVKNAFSQNKIKGWNGFQYARLQKTAFESTKINGILKEFDIDLIQKVSSIYEFQETYIDFGKSIFNKAIDTNSSSKVIDLIATIKLMTTDLLGLEKSLNERLKKTTAELKMLHNSGVQ